MMKEMKTHLQMAGCVWPLCVCSTVCVCRIAIHMGVRVGDKPWYIWPVTCWQASVWLTGFPRWSI